MWEVLGCYLTETASTDSAGDKPQEQTTYLVRESPVIGVIRTEMEWVCDLLYLIG